MTVNSPDGPCKQKGRAKGKAKFLSHTKHPLYFHQGSSSKEPNETCQQITSKVILYKKNSKTVTAQNSRRGKNPEQKRYCPVKRAEALSNQ